MLAARWHGRGDVRVEDIDPPADPPPGWIRIDVTACGICGTDVEEYVAGPTVIPTTPNPLTGRAAPLVLGHECVGVVESAGDGVDLAVGTAVAVEGTVSCGSCLWCRDGTPNLCVDVAWLGLRGDGGLAERMLAPASACVPLPAEADPFVLALAEPLSVAVRAVGRGGVRPGSTVGVVGCGTVGLLAVQAARRAGASLVVAVEPHDRRRALAAGLGADVAVGPIDAMAAMADATGDTGLDVVIEVTGTVTGVGSAVALTRRGGCTAVLGIFPPTPVPLDLTDVVLGEKRLVASLSHTIGSDFPRAVDLLVSGAVTTEGLVTAKIPLRGVVTDGLDVLVQRPQDHLKILVTP